MENYNFHKLTPIEFEELVNDLLEKEYNVRIERFKEGRDKGIDGRFINSKGEKVIIQSKHYKSGYNNLLNILGKKIEKNNGNDIEIGELVKVEKLKKENQLDKYIFATSVGLTPDNKNKIFNIFKGFIENESYIFGNNELNSILFKNKDIELKYNKLWLNSTNILEEVLKNVIYNDIIGRSEDFILKFFERSIFFYKTSDYYKAKELLDKNNVIIITGEPGIGKSTLSEQLCLEYVTKEKYKFFKISKNINEAEKIWKDEENQIFYFDDFLGSNYLEKVEGKDTDIKNFIDRIKRNKLNEKTKNKIFILNSRTTVLKSGTENSSINGFKEDIKENEFILKINEITKEEKAYILYNHLFYSDLEEEYIDVIFEDKNYNKIINHSNYRPRLIEFITNKKRVTVNKEEYLKFVIDNLDNPKEIWKQVFEKQSNNYVNHIVYLTVFNGGQISETILKNKYNIFVKKINHGFIPSNYTFENTLEIAVDNFLIRKEVNGVIFYSHIDPSITDYILHKYINDYDFLIDLFDALGTNNGLKQLYNLYQNGISKKSIFNLYSIFSKNNNDIIKISFEAYIKIIKGLLAKPLKNQSYDYIIELYDLGYYQIDNKKIISDFLQDFIDTYINLETINISKLLKIISKSYDGLIIKNFNFLFKYIEKIDLNESSIEYIFEILDNLSYNENFEGYSNELINLLEEKITKYFENEIEDKFNDINFDDYIDDYDDALNFNLDNLTEDKLSEIIDKWESFSSYKGIFDYINIDVTSIYEGLGIDLEDNLQDYKNNLIDENEINYERFKEESKYKTIASTSSKEENIDYIFTKK